MGRLVEKVSGESLDTFVQREILDPLGMKHTFYGIDANEPQMKNVANLYLGKPNNWNPFWTPEAKPFYPFAWGSQTLYSTTTDYAKFLTMIANHGRVGDRQLLSQAAVKRMLEPVSLLTIPGSDVAAPTGFRDLKQFYGQMMVTYRETSAANEPTQDKPQILGHSGSDGTCGWAWPDRKLVVLYFTQSRGGNTPLRMEEKLDELLIHPENGSQAIPERLQPYVGTYIANFEQFKDEEFEVRVRAGKLILDVPSQRAFELLEPNAQQKWAFKLLPDKIQVSFTRNAGNEVVGLVIHQGENDYSVPRKGMPAASASPSIDDD